MEALHQLAELFQKSVAKGNNTSTSVAPPIMSPTREAPQTRVPISTTPTRNAHPHLSNIIEDDHGNQPLGLDHRTQPLGLGLPPQRKTSTPHCIPSDSVPSPRVARIQSQNWHAISKVGTTATVPNLQPHPSAKLHLSQVSRCGKLHRNRRIQFRHSPNHRSSPRIPPPHKGR